MPSRISLRSSGLRFLIEASPEPKSTDNSFSLGAIDIEYRIDPSGKIRNTHAAHTGEGKMFSFAAAQLLVDDLKSGQTLTLRASRGGDSASFTETLDITDFDAAFIRLDCQLQ